MSLLGVYAFGGGFARDSDIWDDGLLGAAAYLASGGPGLHHGLHGGAYNTYDVPYTAGANFKMPWDTVSAATSSYSNLGPAIKATGRSSSSSSSVGSNVARPIIDSVARVVTGAVQSAAKLYED